MGLGVVAYGGEKFKITDSPDQVQLPKDQELRSAPGADKITGGESSRGPLLPPPNAAPVRSPKLDEFIDRKKNWLFDSSNTTDRRDPSLQEIYGVRKYDLDGWDKKPKSQTEKYFESKDAKKTGNSKNGANPSTPGSDPMSNRSDSGKNGRFGDREEPQAAESAGIIQALNPAPLFNWDSGPDTGARVGSSLNRGSILPRGFADTPFGQRPFAQPTSTLNSAPQRELERPWEYRKSPAVGRLGDPINDSSDSTRSFMNPISARKASVPAPESVQSRMGESTSPFGSSAPTVSTRPDFFSPTTKPISAPSYSPPVATPASSPILSPKPALLEIPRPKF
jgi:hypothetical protein